MWYLLNGRVLIGLCLLMLTAAVGLALAQEHAGQARPVATAQAETLGNATPQAEALAPANATSQAEVQANPLMQPVEGAFGYRLGEVWDGPAEPAEPGLLKAEVPPLVDSGVFDFHSLWLDPQQHAIVQISASRAFPTVQEAEKAHLALVGLLTAKYGAPRTEQTRQVFEVQGRSIHVIMSLEGGLALLGVVYQDDKSAAAALTRPRFELTLPDIPGYNETGPGPSN